MLEGPAAYEMTVAGDVPTTIEVAPVDGFFSPVSRVMTSAEPPRPPSPPSSGSGSGSLRAPQGCAEWAVVILGVIWVVLAIVFVVAFVVRLSS